MLRCYNDIKGGQDARIKLERKISMKKVLLFGSVM